MNEKWVVVELYGDYSGVIDVHGIFENRAEAEDWANNQWFNFEVKRIKKAVVDEWA